MYLNIHATITLKRWESYRTLTATSWHLGPSGYVNDSLYVVCSHIAIYALSQKKRDHVTELYSLLYSETSLLSSD